MEFIEVDGSEGEGGGQILRAAVAFSAILNKPVRVSNIRAGRPEPGLKTQHLSALKVLSEVFNGELSGGKLGSQQVTFVPGAARGGRYSADMRTAASITLALQAVIPAAALAGQALTLELVGGTDVPWSPTFDYFVHVVRSAFSVIGIGFNAESSRRGYYPRGGGKVSAAVEPCTSIRAVDLTVPPKIRRAEVISRCGALPRHVAERQLESATDVLQAAGVEISRSHLSLEPADSPGSSVLVYLADPGAFIGADSLGARGRRAEDVGADAARRFIEAARSGACLDRNIADMVVPLLSLAPGVSRAKVESVSGHLRSGMRLARKFTSADFEVVGGEGVSTITVNPSRRI